MRRSLRRVDMRRAFVASVLFAALGSAQDKPETLRDEPAARAIYDLMLGTLLDSKTLYYECAYRWEAKGRDLGRARYKAWLRKPNQFRIEAVGERGEGGTLVGDGEVMWTHWRGDRPDWNDEPYEQWEKTRRNVYMRAPAPPKAHSIAHSVGQLGAGMGMTVLNPSKFHGAPSSMDEYIDGVMLVGAETVDGEECDVIEVSFMSRQRSQFFWVSRRDRLPRLQKGVVRVGSGDIVTHEHWTDVRIDGEIADEMFAWTPPEGWREWRRPQRSASRMEPGTEAPAFTASLLGGGTTRLSDYRGKIVWLCFWRVG